MRSNYKRLGGFIHKVENRNRELKVSKLVGLSMTKEFRESTSNTVGTDMSVYKVVGQWQFSCDFMSVIRVHKFPVVLKYDNEPVLVSPAYTVFEVNDAKELDPQYLMMWFRRSEFDRYADFKCDSAIRGGFDWDALCDCELPIPSIEKQQEIVREYNIIQNRIALNNQLISKLEETAQTIYKQWFVDFEFPHNLCQSEPVEDQKIANNLGYKSSGGKMVWCGELEKEIPERWRVKSLDNFGKVITGKTPSSEYPEEFGNEMLFVTPGDFKFYNKFAFKTDRLLSNKGILKLKSKVLPAGSVIVTCIGSDMGKVVVTDQECITNQQMNSIVVSNIYYSDYLFEYLKHISSEIKAIAMGSSTMPMLNKTEFEKILIIKPIDMLLIKYQEVSRSINKSLLNYTKENQKLEEFKELLLAKMTRVEIKTVEI